MKATIKRLARKMWHKMGVVRRPIGRKMEGVIVRSTQLSVSPVLTEMQNQRQHLTEVAATVQAVQHAMHATLERSLSTMELNLDSLVREVVRLQYQLESLGDRIAEMEARATPESDASPTLRRVA
ncbi:hypothetical protein [Tuwongella immobilis]|uniref:Uncharacterized protein n=1 Tax=Tuwongella immobilis TaxID=692036 RepID=A0A6C2YT00_9BACT|nr:hypothetical protein [Tuwongella immobilis]VIP04457.1 unnamed protein product [Tuwongella immobilis]VTS06276.1 unnamed protein product [Tuwongella immobilis]